MVKLLTGCPVLLLGDDMPALFLLNLFLLLNSFALDLLAKINSVLPEVKLLVWCSINLDNGILQQSLGTHQLIAGGIVDHIKDTHFLGAILRAPGKIAGIQAQSAVLVVATPAPHRADTLATKLGHGWRATHLELPLLLVNVTATSSLPVLVA